MTEPSLGSPGRSRPALVWAILAFLVCSALTVLGASVPASAAGLGVRVSGGELDKDGYPFEPRGFNAIGLLTPSWCATTSGQAAATHFGQAELDAAKAWNANTLRFQVSQRGLADPAVSAADRAAYLQHVVDGVRLARADGFVVVVSMQDQSLGCGPAHPLPSSLTTAAWQVLAPQLMDDPDVLLELFNEPAITNTSAGWAQWRDGGVGPTDNLGDVPVGHQTLVDQLRAMGVRNVLVADGLNKAGRLAGVPLLRDDLGQVAYGIHPYVFTAGQSWWDQQWGFLTSAPVLATEWNYLASACSTTAPTVAVDLLAYLHAHHIGLLAHALDYPGATMTSGWTWSPTACGTTEGGSGQTTEDYFAGLSDAPAPLGPPTGLRATTPDATDVDLTWTDGPGPVASYEVLRDSLVVGATAEPRFTDATASPGAAYSYTVRALDAGGSPGPQSDPLAVAMPVVADVTAPSSPTSLVASTPVGDRVDLGWQASTDDAGVAGYVVQRDGVDVAEAAGTTYTDASLRPGTSYDYTVVAVDAAGNRSAPSDAVHVDDPLPPDTTPPSTPTGLSPFLLTPTSSRLTWQPSSDDVGVTGYRVRRDGVEVATTTATSFLDTAMPSGATHTYTVTAFDRAGNESALPTGVTVVAPAAAPPGLTGKYYDTATFTTLKATRIDPTVDFAWGTGAPLPGMGADTFSVRWTGRVVPRASETVTFYVLSDDGARLWVNGVLVVDRWFSHPSREDLGTIALKANRSYSVKLDFREKTGSSQARLSWSAPSTVKAVVPASNLLAR